MFCDEKLAALTLPADYASWLCPLLTFLQVGLGALDRIAEVVFVYDVVPFKDRARLVSADFQRNAFGYAGPNHIAHSCSPEIVEQSCDVLALVIALGTNHFFH